MDATLIALHAAVLAAALLQAATGIGFGVIAGPIILMVMNSGAAVQVTILLSLLIAVVLTPSLYRQVDKKILGRLLLGTLVGLPLGILIFLNVSLDVLMLLAALAVLFMALSVSGLLGLPLRKGETSRGEVVGDPVHFPADSGVNQKRRAVRKLDVPESGERPGKLFSHPSPRRP